MKGSIVKFIAFLIAEAALENWLRVAQSQGEETQERVEEALIVHHMGSDRAQNPLIQLMAVHVSPSAPLQAFDWSKTEEGPEYWGDLTKKWLRAFYGVATDEEVDQMRQAEADKVIASVKDSN